MEGYSLKTTVSYKHAEFEISRDLWVTDNQRLPTRHKYEVILRGSQEQTAEATNKADVFCFSGLREKQHWKEKPVLQMSSLAGNEGHT